MFKRILSLVIACLMLPAVCLAEDFVPYQVYTFAASLPAQLKQPLSNLVPDERSILSGASIQHNGYNIDDPSPEYHACYSAMLLVDSDDGLRLYAAAQPEGLPWQVNDYTHLLRGNRNVSISIYQPEATRVPRISVDYHTSSGLVSDLMVFWNNQLWCLTLHIDQANDITIDNEMGMLAIKDDAGRESFRCDNPFFLDYMADMSAFPTSRAEAQAITWLPTYEPFAAGMTLYCEGANLRRESTTKAESLGQYARNVPMIFTGEQKQGTSWPWYQVRIGDTLGWMSGNYVDDEPNLGYAPITLGRTVDGCNLYASAGDSQPIAQLAPGTTFHILTEYKGMYHICIPQDDISWAVDQNGVYGYISTRNILTGASPSALDALQVK